MWKKYVSTEPCITLWPELFIKEASSCDAEFDNPGLNTDMQERKRSWESEVYVKIKPQNKQTKTFFFIMLSQ